MELHPLDADLEVETFDVVQASLASAQAILMAKYHIPQHMFVPELTRRLRSGDIADEPDVMRWQALYAALLDWANDDQDHEDPAPEPAKALLSSEHGRMHKSGGGHVAVWLRSQALSQAHLLFKVIP